MISGIIGTGANSAVRRVEGIIGPLFWFVVIASAIIILTLLFITFIDKDDDDLSINEDEQKKYNKAKKYIAIHEAGHAVTSLTLGFELKDVEIKYKKTYEKDMFSGVTHYSLKNDGFMTEENMRNLVTIAYAGPVAEKIIIGKIGYDNVSGEYSDFEKAELIIKKIILASDEYKVYVACGKVFDEMMNEISSELFAEAEKIVKENLDDIKKVANQLYENNFLMGEHIKRIIELN